MHGVYVCRDAGGSALQTKYGEVITSLTVRGRCQFVLTKHHDGSNRQIPEFCTETPLGEGDGCVLADGHRWFVLHATREVSSDDQQVGQPLQAVRLAVLVRLDVPGRLGLVPMYHNHEFRGYRRLSTNAPVRCTRGWGF